MHNKCVFFLHCTVVNFIVSALYVSLVQVTRWWGESGDHYITANYKYLCKNKPEHRNGWAVHNIEIKLRVLGEDPISRNTNCCTCSPSVGLVS